MDQTPLHLYAEPITVIFDQPPALEKKPACPDGFIWRGVTYRAVTLVKEWVDYRRRGRMARNMQPQHAIVAEGRGSWGVGRFYYQVSVDTGQLFEIYYDRAPKDIDSRKGSWVLVGEYTQPSTL
jgi:hypothetical protein